MGHTFRNKMSQKLNRGITSMQRGGGGGGRWGRRVVILNILKSKDMSFKVESIKL